ncbi:LOW QUALITY PROTEIN: fatty acyl-CoA reductase wat-like isoform X1 [Vespula squamosa]|uniref:Fatty acyl-CoA reductase n=1 Tax=Vespula squamosa TaxID=30214 RepID=A0ABD2C943_VESSQ
MYQFTDRFGKAKMTKVLLEEDRQKMDVAESSFRDIMKSQYVSADIESSVEYMDKPIPLQNFYDGQGVFVTGATDFIGKLLIEKLLRECPGIIYNYLLTRTKKGKSMFQRTKELIEDSLFHTLREKQPTFQNRIVTIGGDSSLPKLGISKIDKATLICEVSIVFNVAATVKFNETIKLATAINVQSGSDKINKSKEMSKLKISYLSFVYLHCQDLSMKEFSFIHVSTAHANFLQNPIEEKFYDPPIDDDRSINLTNSMNKRLLDIFIITILPHCTLLGIWSNSYLYTKSVAENIIKKHVGSIPIGIFRSGIGCLR